VTRRRTRTSLLVAAATAAWLALVACAPAVVVRDHVWPDPWPVAEGAWVCPEAPLAPRYQPTLYVASDGDDAADGRTPASALATLQRAADLARAGDVVWVRGGAYSADVAFRRSGTALAPIVFESHPGECAVLDGRGLEPLQRPRFEGVHHVVFRNFEVRDAPAEGIFVGASSDVTVAHVRVSGSAGSGVLVLGGRGNLLSHVIAHDNVDRPDGGDADGISISSGEGHRVERCVVFANSDDGVDTWTSTHTLVERCVAFGNGLLEGDGNGFKLGGRDRRVATVARWNVAFGNRADGFDVNSGRGVRLDHNTAYGNGGYGFEIAAAVARHNLAVGNAGGPQAQGLPALLEQANSWNLAGAGDAADPFVSTDPADPSFLALADGSFAVGVGARLDASGPLAAAGAGAPVDLGALPRGRTIADLVGISVGPLTQASRGAP
jgi:hypothetical protein